MCSDVLICVQLFEIDETLNALTVKYLEDRSLKDQMLVTEPGSDSLAVWLYGSMALWRTSYRSSSAPLQPSQPCIAIHRVYHHINNIIYFIYGHVLWPSYMVSNAMNVTSHSILIMIGDQPKLSCIYNRGIEGV